VNQVRTRLAALSLLDRAFAQLTDDDLRALLEPLDADVASAVDHISGWRADEADDDVQARISAIRQAAQRGRINGDLERLAVVLTNACLEDCIRELGDASEHPSEEDLQRVLPGLIERHGLAPTQVMLASVVAGEAVAAPVITRMLKHDELVKLPPAEARPVAPPPASPVDDAERERLRAERKARRKAEQDAARARREQAAAAKRKR
jgi:hypothetical protein